MGKDAKANDNLVTQKEQEIALLKEQMVRMEAELER